MHSFAISPLGVALCSPRDLWQSVTSAVAVHDVTISRCIVGRDVCERIVMNGQGLPLQCYPLVRSTGVVRQLRRRPERRPTDRQPQCRYTMGLYTLVCYAVRFRSAIVYHVVTSGDHPRHKLDPIHLPFLPSPRKLSLPNPRARFIGAMRGDDVVSS